jgi:hypothetical protein
METFFKSFVTSRSSAGRSGSRAARRMPSAAWCTTGARDSRLDSDSANAGAAINRKSDAAAG